MASGPAGYEYLPPPPVPEATVRRWDRSDAAIGLALAVLAVSLFLPWFSGTVRLGNETLVGNGALSGTRAHGYLWVVLVLAIVAMVVLVARDAIRRIPGNLPSPGQLLVGTIGLALILTVLGLAFRPPGISAGSFGWTGYAPLQHFSVSASWSYGGFVAVAAAAVAFVAAFISGGPVQEASRAAQAGNQASPAGG
ncbi:MAG: hypothetical protein ACLQFR_22420 [Streptosporangiaceae bacterium]